ncbi:MAG TPA: PAS domain S-box protein [Bacteroidia bacterium]|nr:PAS domain S-box protein [Bacteroidia bacterium]
MAKTDKHNSDTNSYKSIVENLPLPIAIISFEGKILFANKKAVELSGLSSKDFNLKNAYDFVKPQFIDKLNERRKNLSPGKELPPIEIEVKNSKGKPVFIEIKSSYVTYDGSPAIQVIITDTAINRQLLEEKTRNKQVKKINLQLKKEIDLRTQSEQKLRAIFESGTQLMWTVNKNISLTSFNKNYREAIYNTYGVYPQINTDLNKPKIKFAPDDYHSFWDEKYAEAFSGKTVEFETETITLSGEKKHRFVTLHPIYNEKKEIIEVAGQAHDVTEQKKDRKEVTHKKSQLEAIINTTDDIIFSVDKNYKISEFNNVLKNVVKARHGVDVKQGVLVFDILPIQYHEDVKSRYDRALSGENVLAIEKFYMEEEEFVYEAHYSPIKIGGKVTGVAVFSKDVTAREYAQQEVLDKQSQLKTIINTTNDIIFSMDKNYNVVQCNEVLREIALYRTGKEMYPGMNFFDFLPPEMRQELKKTYDLALKGENVVAVETFFHPKTKKYRTYEANYNPIIINNKIVGVSVFSKDVTEQKEIQQKILNTQTQLAAIINNTTDIVVSIDKNYNVVQFNQLLFQMVKGRDGVELKEGMSVFVTMDESHHDDMKNIYQRVFNEGQSLVAVEIFSIGGDKKRYFESNYNPIKQGAETVGIAIFSRDISEKIASETDLREALREKEILLKEVHHRVKNNLQVISSILNLQTSYVKDKETANILRECQNRIKTMAFIHESLYQTKDFSQINFSEYITNLVKNLFYSYDANQQKIKANFDVDTIFLNLDTSIPCGLIVNELVSNAFKYAFADGSQGFISVKLKDIGNNKIKMLVADNGKGMPANIDFKNTESLGLQLVNILTEQINGTITLDKTNGTSFEIIF